MPVGETRSPQQSVGGQGGAVLVKLGAKAEQEPDDVVITTPPSAPAPAPQPAAPATPPAAPAPAPAPAAAPPAVPETPAGTQAPAVDPNLLASLNQEFAAKGEISKETIAALAANPNLPKGFDQYVQTYAMLAANRRADNQAAAREVWGANAPAIEESVAQNPALSISILSAPNLAAARLAAQGILAQYAQSNSTAPAVSVVGTGSGGGTPIPAGVPKNADEKYRMVSNPRFLYDLNYMNQVNAAIAKGMSLGIKYD